ncbi:hypothetical protein COV05_05015 [Candidatus Uhrbacteria bacterium CG10_big_fil_rev_8_21_14_0_10_48_16]|uniref:Uncharacterized protein n=1 Tax=Candidatus Uhrbacteria bacterium CG10_big_fil_rev_8_21_14_0_10_48_16 TaxID=1975038 RepID=A0A2M8LG04_9BACT|nr:MAG: hypothetical protein COV05_05015 [Candidatus Uhrbacteria bacterium CG10_big_fil_rev_8_21_14_0_10_48_16]
MRPQHRLDTARSAKGQNVYRHPTSHHLREHIRSTIGTLGRSCPGTPEGTSDLETSVEGLLLLQGEDRRRVPHHAPLA